MEKTKKSNNPVEIFMHGLMFIFGMMSVAFVLFISIFLIVSGVPAIGTIGIKDFLLGTVWASTAADPKFGILPFILTSFWGMAGAIILIVFSAILYMTNGFNGHIPEEPCRNMINFTMGASTATLLLNVLYLKGYLDKIREKKLAIFKREK